MKNGDFGNKTEYVEIQKRDLSVYEFELDTENKAEILIERKIVLKKTDTKEILRRLKTFYEKLKPCFNQNPSEFKINFESNGYIKKCGIPKKFKQEFQKLYRDKNKTPED